MGEIEIIDVEGVKFEVKQCEMIDDLKPDDLYIGKRNTINLLKCLKVIDNEKFGKPYVVPTTNAYAFNLDECYKVIKMLD